MIDLHTHSTYSDGTLSPQALAELASSSGLSAVALCDHNNVDGLPEFLAAAHGMSLTAIPGVEFSTRFAGQEIHLLGLFISPEHYDTVRDRLRLLLEEKDRKNKQMLSAMAEAGLSLDYDSIKAATPGGLVNRAVIAGELVRLGHCGSVQEAFDLWLSRERGFFHPARLPDSLDTIRFIRSIGAVSVLAHPFVSLDENALRHFLEAAVPAGLDAMEVRYATFTPEQTTLAEKIAAEFGLLPSGGSDFHGSNKPEISIGTGKGSLFVPEAFLEALCRRQKTHAKKTGSIWKIPDNLV